MRSSPASQKGCVYLLQNHFRLCLSFGESCYLMDCVASAGDDSFKLLTDSCSHGYVGNFLEELCVSNAREFEAITGL